MQPSRELRIADLLQSTPVCVERGVEAFEDVVHETSDLRTGELAVLVAVERLDAQQVAQEVPERARGVVRQLCGREARGSRIERRAPLGPPARPTRRRRS